MTAKREWLITLIVVVLLFGGLFVAVSDIGGRLSANNAMANPVTLAP